VLSIHVILRLMMVMAEIDLRSRMLVKDVMSSPVITVPEGSPVHKTAQLMDEGRVGCIIVTNKDDKALGIITESDLVTRVLAKNLTPSKLTAKEVMSTPLITVDSDETLTETARRMSKLNVRRMGVIYKGNLVGIISSKDILAVTPELLDNMQEKARIERQPEVEEESSEPSPQAGYCEQCGSWSENLVDVEGTFLCEDCRMEL
jgi:signal-transduction protein with cAMP-binding, CBS, and nucleotidyltransferase domain